jgi:hypothetical protein
MIKTLGVAVALVLASPVVAGVIEIPRSIVAVPASDLETIFNDTNPIAVFTFTVPPPFPGPIIDHGAQHWYSNTRLVSFTFTGQNAVTGVSSFNVLTPRDLGKIKTPQTFSQGFLNSDPFFRLDLLITSPITSVTANLIDSYVPEPGTWMMLIAGFGLVGGAMRRQYRIKAA